LTGLNEIVHAGGSKEAWRDGCHRIGSNLFRVCGEEAAVLEAEMADVDGELETSGAGAPPGVRDLLALRDRQAAAFAGRSADECTRHAIVGEQGRDPGDRVEIERAVGTEGSVRSGDQAGKGQLHGVY